MKFIDTNVVIRLIMHDHPTHLQQAELALASATAGEIYIHEAVLDEVCTVLGLNHMYGMPRQLICDSIERLLEHPALKTSEVALDTLRAFRKHPKLDFVDCLILTLSSGQKNRVLSFDKDLLQTLA